jgi:hypothetical protein
MFSSFEKENELQMKSFRKVSYLQKLSLILAFSLFGVQMLMIIYYLLQHLL